MVNIRQKDHILKDGINHLEKCAKAVICTRIDDALVQLTTLSRKTQCRKVEANAIWKAMAVVTWPLQPHALDQKLYVEKDVLKKVRRKESVAGLERMG